MGGVHVKKKTITKATAVCLFLILVFFVAGCSDVEHGNVNTYKYPHQNRFEIVMHENIDDGTTNGMTIMVLVDKETGVMYMYTKKFKAGYGCALEVLVDENGKPLLYGEKGKE